ncbi:IS1634 family transposase, partial [Corynebacterium sp. 13CS0277]|uniref:IS1634 family transposase n=1 Tax=Corynebacterium sp. 13CS0277 TaxID=2071994 RepID=UPI0011B1CB9A
MRTYRVVNTRSGKKAVQLGHYDHGRWIYESTLGSTDDEATLQQWILQATTLCEPDQLAFDLGITPQDIDVTGGNHTPEDPDATDDGGLFPHPNRPKKQAEKPAGRSAGTPVSIVQGRALPPHKAVLRDVLFNAYDNLGLNVLNDRVFAAMVIAHIVRPSSKAGMRLTFAELGLPEVHYNTLRNRLRWCNERGYRQVISTALHKHVRHHHQVNLVLYDVTTLYFEVDNEDELRRRGKSKEHRVEPQVIVGLLADDRGFPLDVDCWAGNTSEQSTVVGIVNEYKTRYQLDQLIVVADTGMLSA